MHLYPALGISPLALVAIFISATLSSHAQTTWYQNKPSITSPATSWNTLADWSANANGTGANPTSISSLDTFNTNGFNLRTEALNGASTSTFSGAALIINKSNLLLRAGTSIIENLSTSSNGGGIINSAAANGGDKNLELDVGQFIVNGTASIAADTSKNRTLDFEITTLLGTGDIRLGSNYTTLLASTITLSVTNATSFTGNLILTGGTSSALTFGNSFTSGGGLILETGTELTLNQSMSFTSLFIGDQELGAGVYSFAELNEDFNVFFAEGGSGSIRVGLIPEPSSLAALLGTLAIGFATTRRRR